MTFGGSEHFIFDNIPVEQLIHNNETLVTANKLNWTAIFSDTNHPEIPDTIPIEYTGEREKNLMSILLKKRFINNDK